MSKDETKTIKDWKHASKKEIENMTFEEAIEIIDRQLDKANEMYGPRPHFAKALTILRSEAIKNKGESYE